MAVPTLEVVDRTNIDTVSKITLQTPLYIEGAEHTKTTHTVLKAYLWIGTERKTKLLTTPNATYVKRKISVSDD
jgi:hypothetical protein